MEVECESVEVEWNQCRRSVGQCGWSTGQLRWRGCGSEVVWVWKWSGGGVVWGALPPQHHLISQGARSTWPTEVPRAPPAGELGTAAAVYLSLTTQ